MGGGSVCVDRTLSICITEHSQHKHPTPRKPTRQVLGSLSGFWVCNFWERGELKTTGFIFGLLSKSIFFGCCLLCCRLLCCRLRKFLHTKRKFYEKILYKLCELAKSIQKMGFTVHSSVVQQQFVRNFSCAESRPLRATQYIAKIVLTP